MTLESHGCYNRSIMQHVRPEHDPERWQAEDECQPFLFESSDPGSAIAVIRETPIETSLEKLILFNGDIDEKG